MFRNIAVVKSVRNQFLQRIATEIEQIQVPHTSVRRAEVGLLVMIELH